jgi:hypothetical protein
VYSLTLVFGGTKQHLDHAEAEADAPPPGQRSADLPYTPRKPEPSLRYPVYYDQSHVPVPSKSRAEHTVARRAVVRRWSRDPAPDKSNAPAATPPPRRVIPRASVVRQAAARSTPPPPPKRRAVEKPAPAKSPSRSRSRSASPPRAADPPADPVSEPVAQGANTGTICDDADEEDILDE